MRKELLKFCLESSHIKRETLEGFDSKMSVNALNVYLMLNWSLERTGENIDLILRNNIKSLDKKNWRGGGDRERERERG